MPSIKMTLELLADEVALAQPTGLCALDATGLTELYRMGKATPVDAFEASAERIALCEPSLNAMTHPNDNARAEAEASARRWRAGTPAGPLDGVPVTIKDNLAAAGMPATFGSRAYSRWVPDADELPVSRVREAGAIFIGKTNLPEFALEGYTDNALFGATGNPFDPSLTPGGSTGGGAASVAAGYVPIALGTDGGGSLRRPAAHCGLFSLKTSIGRIPRLGGLPQLLLDFEVAGALTRTMRDTALLYEVMAGPDARVPESQHLPSIGSPGKPLTILAVERLDGAPLDPEIASSFRQFVASLERLGHRVQMGTLPPAVHRLAEVWPDIGASELGKLFTERPDIAAAASPKYQKMAAAGQSVPASRLAQIPERVGQLKQEVAALFQTVDVVVTPAIAALAWPKAEAFPPTIDGIAVGPRGHAIYTGWVNAAGIPALAFPASPASDGRQIGAQLVGAFGAERLLLSLGEEIARDCGML